MEQKVYCEVELEGVITVKKAFIPANVNKHDFVTANEYVRKYFISLGYEKVGYVKIC